MGEGCRGGDEVDAGRGLGEDKCVGRTRAKLSVTGLPTKRNEQRFGVRQGEGRRDGEREGERVGGRWVREIMGELENREAGK